MRQDVKNTGKTSVITNKRMTRFNNENKNILLVKQFSFFTFEGSRQMRKQIRIIKKQNLNKRMTRLKYALILAINFDVVLILYYIPNQTNLTCHGPTLTLRGPCNNVSNDFDISTLVTSINFDVNIYVNI